MKKSILLKPGESKLWTLLARHEWVKQKSQKLGHVLYGKTNMNNLLTMEYICIRWQSLNIYKYKLSSNANILELDFKKLKPFIFVTKHF